MKLARKQRIGARIKRVYDVPKTPFQRLIASGRLSTEQEESLGQLYLTLNPADLKRRIDKKLGALYALYHKKNKKPLVVNPYKKQAPSMVTFWMSEQPELRLPA
ncbi:MAG TPA: hypothetical protein PLX50_10535 [Candidatus Aminicenantes bacterium]|nr:hypothetical protein [Candidatus Aminicenantes bacterium]